MSVRAIHPCVLCILECFACLTAAHACMVGEELCCKFPCQRDMSLHICNADLLCEDHSALFHPKKPDASAASTVMFLYNETAMRQHGLQGIVRQHSLLSTMTFMRCFPCL